MMTDLYPIIRAAADVARCPGLATEPEYRSAVVEELDDMALFSDLYAGTIAARIAETQPEGASARNALRFYRALEARATYQHAAHYVRRHGVPD